METKETILNGQYNHIYQRCNNGIDVFLEHENYTYFLSKYLKYTEPIADTYAWCLLKNHFHILVRIKDKNQIVSSKFPYNTTTTSKIIDASRQFAHFLNSYTQGINKVHKRSGALFESTFERKLVDSEDYLKKLIFYIHNNPVSHGFVKDLKQY